MQTVRGSDIRVLHKLVHQSEKSNYSIRVYQHKG